MTRNKLIDIVKDPNLEVETLETAMQQYFSLLLGLIFPPKGTVSPLVSTVFMRRSQEFYQPSFILHPFAGVQDSGGDSKLRYAFTFRWNDSLQSYDQEPT